MAFLAHIFATMLSPEMLILGVLAGYVSADLFIYAVLAGFAILAHEIILSSFSGSYSFGFDRLLIDIVAALLLSGIGFALRFRRELPEAFSTYVLKSPVVFFRGHYESVPLGFRRLGMVVVPIVIAIVVVITIRDEDSYTWSGYWRGDALAIMLLEIIAVPVLYYAAVRIWLWVASGFSASEK